MELIIVKILLKILLSLINLYPKQVFQMTFTQNREIDDDMLQEKVEQISGQALAMIE